MGGKTDDEKIYKRIQKRGDQTVGRNRVGRSVKKVRSKRVDGKTVEKRSRNEQQGGERGKEIGGRKPGVTGQNKGNGERDNTNQERERVFRRCSKFLY